MTTACMRWKPGRVQTWRRPEDGGFDARRYDVAAIGEAPARAYVEARHYSGTWPAARLRYGLLDVSGHTPRLAGVAVLSVPVSKRALQQVFPDLAPFLNHVALSTHWCCLPGRLPMAWLLTPDRLTGLCRPDICVNSRRPSGSAGVMRTARWPPQRVAGFLVAEAPVCCRIGRACGEWTHDVELALINQLCASSSSIWADVTRRRLSGRLRRRAGNCRLWCRPAPGHRI